MHKRGYLFLNILVMTSISMSLFTIIITTMSLTKKHYQARINELEIKTMLEAKAMQIANATKVSTKLDLGWIEDAKFYYRITLVNNKYMVEVKYLEMMDLVYYQIFDSRYTGTSYQYIIYEEGYRGD